MLNAVSKAVIAGTAALMISGAGLAIAQQTQPPAQQPAPTDAQRYQPTAEDRAALLDARIAALKAGLKHRFRRCIRNGSSSRTRIWLNWMPKSGANVEMRKMSGAISVTSVMTNSFRACGALRPVER